MLQQTKTGQPAYLIAGVLFTLIAIAALVALLVVKSKADTADQLAEVTNSDPVVDYVIVSDTAGAGDIGPALTGTGFTTNEGNPRTIYVRAQVSDDNGCMNMMSGTVVLYRSGATGGFSCSSDTNDCYRTTLNPATDFNLDSCSGAGDDTAAFEKSFSFVNYVDPTDTGDYADDTWLAYVKIDDYSERSATAQADFEVNSLAAFSVPSSINYGTVGLGLDSNAIGLTFSNTGNRAVDSDVIASTENPLVGDMTSNLSGFDNIAASAVHYSLTSGFTYGTGDTAVSKTASTDLALNLLQQKEDGDIPTTDTYWRLRMPDQGVNGTYTNVIVFTAKVAAAAAIPVGLIEMDTVDYSQEGSVELTYIDTANEVAYTSLDTEETIVVMNVSDSSNVVELGSVTNVLANPTSISKTGNYLYITSSAASNNFQVIDVSNSAAPTIVATMTALSGGVVKGYANGTYAYVIGGTNKFATIDITNPLVPSVVSGSTVNFDYEVKDFIWTGIYTFVYMEDSAGAPLPHHGYISTLDLTDPASPSVPGSSFQTYTDAKITDVSSYLVIVGNNSDMANSVQTINRDNPASLVLADEYSINNNAVNSITESNNVVYIADTGTELDSLNINSVAIDTEGAGTITLVDSARVGAYNAAGSFFDIAVNNVGLDYFVYLAGKTDGIYRVLTGSTPPASEGGPKK